MKTIEILEAANKYYPDEFLSEYYKRVKGTHYVLRQQGSGDGLAEFIVSELIEAADDIDSAVHVLENAKRDLNLAIAGLEEKR